MKNNGCFKKGHVPWNKGTHINNGGNNYKTWFKKGTIPPNTRKVGTIVQHSDGYSYIKTKHGLKLYHRYIYEQTHHCKVPKEKIVIFLDGNRSNCSPDNLVAISKGENAILNHLQMLDSGNAEISRTNIMRMRLKMKTQGAQKSLNPIYRLRKKHGWTRQKLADRANINPITIRRIELGSHAKKWLLHWA